MFLENKSNKIIKGIFIGGIVYILGCVLISLATLSTMTSEIGYYISVGILYLGSLCKPIGTIVIFKFFCDILYKLLKALDKYNNN